MHKQPMVYLAGEYLSASQARISPFDRGYLFADAVYEVIPVFAGKTFALAEHLERLQQSLAAVDIVPPHLDWLAIIQQLIKTNLPVHGKEMLVYVQVSRGVPERRDHAVPTNLAPQVLAFTQAIVAGSKDKLYQGISAITLADIRWGRCDIKSTALLASVLLKQQATAAGVDEALLLDAGYLREGTASNAFVVKDKIMYTPPLSNKILAGITRAQVIKVARDNGISCYEQDISAAALASADEVWITSSTKDIVPVVCIDGAHIGDGQPGAMWHRLLSVFQAYKNSCLC
jgi:D-alanine transaminase